MTIVNYIFEIFGIIAFLYILITQGRKLYLKLTPFLTLESRVTKLEADFLSIHGSVADLKDRHNLDKKVVK